MQQGRIDEYAAAIARGIATDSRLHNPDFARWASQKIPIWESFIARKLAEALLEEETTTITNALEEADPICRFNPSVHIVSTPGLPATLGTTRPPEG